MSDSPLISVYCLTYNHEKYIKDTLEGFVNQKTDFPFEVFVHDDASSDNTPMIIQEYARKYPNIIKPILQSENQYSKGVKIVREFIIPNIKGKYIAACEGDDYWNDVNKLQTQVNFLEEHPDYVACVHNTLKIDYKKNNLGTFNTLETDCDLKTEDVLLRVKSGFFHFNSIVYKAKYLINERPEFFTKTPGVGDYPLSIYLALNGKIRYINKTMSVYRMFVPGSWTDKNRRKSPKEQIKHKHRLIEMLKSANDYSNYKYNDTIDKKVNQLLYEKLAIEGDFSSIKNNPQLYDVYRSQGIKQRILVYLKCNFKFLYRLYRKIKKLLMGNFN